MRLFNPKLAALGGLGQTAVTNATRQKLKGTVIFLHGSCDTGSGMKNWLNQIASNRFKFQEFNILYPSAPLRPYSLLNGQETGIWYDRISLSPQMPEDTTTIKSSARELQDFILAQSEKTGIAVSQMVLGGFSTGGSMALHTAYGRCPELAGVFAISSFLAQDSDVYEFLEKKTQPNRKGLTKLQAKTEDVQNEGQSRDDTKEDNQLTTTRNVNVKSKVRLPPLFMSHGLKDTIARYPWAKSTFCKLRDLGVDGHFFAHPETTHSIDKTQLAILHKWIDQVLTAAAMRKKT